MSEESEVFLNNFSSKNPYVGPRPFTEQDHLYGRDHEIRELLELLIAERIVLLHSPSGAGKSSLIRAGLIKELERQKFEVLPIIRVGLVDPDLANDGDKLESNRYLSSIKFSLEKMPMKQMQYSDRRSLKDYLKDYNPSNDHNKPRLRVLIFDQFEEILTLNPIDEDKKYEFFKQLGEVLSDQSWWALFAMRDEYVAALAPYLDYIPTCLNTKYRLKTLDIHQAEEAIKKPTNKSNIKFTDDAIKQIIKNLRKVKIQTATGKIEEREGSYIEPVQLQVVCHWLWEKNLKSDDPSKIHTTDVSTLGNFDDALSHYYDEQLKEISKGNFELERFIRRWFEDKLITNQKIRNQVSSRDKEIQNTIINQLKDAHLIREVGIISNFGAQNTFYELSHDRFIDPICDSNAKWFTNHQSLLERKASYWEQSNKSHFNLLWPWQIISEGKWYKAHEKILAKDVKDHLKEYLDKSKQVGLFSFLFIMFLIVTIIIVIIVEQYQQQKDKEIIAESYRLSSDALAQLNINPELASLLGLYAYEEQKKVKDDNLTIEVKTTLQNIIQTPYAQLQFQHKKGKYFGIPSDQKQDDQHDFLPKEIAIGNNPFNNKIKVYTGRIENDDKTGKLIFPGINVWESLIDNGKSKELTDPSSFIRVEDADHTPGIRINNRAFTFSRDGSYSAIITPENEIQLWHLNSANATGIEKVRSESLADSSQKTDSLVTISPDNKVLAALLFNRDSSKISIHFFDIDKKSSNKITCDFPKEKIPGSSSTIALSSLKRNNSYFNFAVGTSLGKILIFHMPALSSTSPCPKFDQVKEFKSSDDMIHTMNFRYLRPRTTLALRLRLALRLGVAATSIPFSGGECLLASGSADGIAKIWNVCGDPTLVFALSNHNSRVSHIAFSPDGKLIATASWDGTAKLWSSNDGRELLTLPGYGKALAKVAFSPNNGRLVTLSNDGFVRVWKVDYRTTYFTDKVNAVAFNKQYLASGGYDKSFTILRLGTNNSLEFVRKEKSSYPIRSISSDPKNNEEICFAYTGLGGMAAISCVDGKNKEVGPLEGHNGVVYGADFSPNGKWLATASYSDIEKPLIIWDWDKATDKELSFLRPQGLRFVDVAFSSRPNILATAGINGWLQLWKITKSDSDLYTLEPIKLQEEVEKSHSTTITSVIFSKDGKRMASAGLDNKIFIWRIISLEEVSPNFKKECTLSVPYIVIRITFSSDGKYLAAAGWDNTVRIWDVEKKCDKDMATAFQKNMVATFKLHAAANDVAFSEDGKYLAIASSDNQVHIFPFNNDEELIKQVKDRVVGNKIELKGPECQQYMHKETCAPLPY